MPSSRKHSSVLGYHQEGVINAKPEHTNRQFPKIITNHKSWSPQDVTRAEISDLISMTKTAVEDDYPFKTMD